MASVLVDSDRLLELVADCRRKMALPKGIPTLESMVTKNWTWTDNVFCSTSLVDKLVMCTTDPGLQGPGMDHIPILTTLELPVEQTQSPPTCNFCVVDLETFQKKLSGCASVILGPPWIQTAEEFE